MFIFCVTQGVSYYHNPSAWKVPSLLKVQVCWQCFFKICWKSLFPPLFLKDIVAEHRSLSMLTFFPLQLFKDATPSSSDLHSFRREVCCHSCLFVLCLSASKVSCLVFSSLNMIYLDGNFFACLFLLVFNLKRHLMDIYCRPVGPTTAPSLISMWGLRI